MLSLLIELDSPVYDQEKVYKRWQDVSNELTEKKKQFYYQITSHLDPQHQNPTIATVGLVDQSWSKEAKMVELLKNAPEILQNYRQLRAIEAQQEQLRKQVDELVAKRMSLLRRPLDNLASESGLPEPRLASKITFPEEPDVNGSYSIGKGRLLVKERLLMNSDRPSAELISTIAHELAHHEQDTLIIRCLADELRIGTKASAIEKQQLAQLYIDKTGYHQLADSFVDHVLTVRNGQQLTEGQAKRAAGLMESVKDLKTSQAAQQQREKAITRLSKAYDSMKEDPMPLALLEVTLGSDPTRRLIRAQELLAISELPAELSQSLNKLADVERAGLSSTNLHELREEALEALKTSILGRLIYLTKQTHKVYRSRLHELESHEAVRLALLFANPPTQESPEVKRLSLFFTNPLEQ